ncbi:uncharacterized protein DEA37_0010014, partial [Paragonimus westermani]
MLTPSLWVQAASQNAFDTGAAMALFVSYSAYFTRKNGAVRFGTLIPLVNNTVSSLRPDDFFYRVLYSDSNFSHADEIRHFTNNADEWSRQYRINFYLDPRSVRLRRWNRSRAVRVILPVFVVCGNHLVNRTCPADCGHPQRLGM